MNRGGESSSGGLTSSTARWRPVFDHLVHLTDERGLFEHARFDAPRPEHGYCLDDAARGLIVTCREPRPDPVVMRLRECYLGFILAAVSPDGTCHNRMDADGEWRDGSGTGDWWGRAVWSLGVAAAQPAVTHVRARAIAGFRLAAQQRAPFPRAMAFAALGASEVLRTRPDELAARELLQDAIGVIDHPDGASSVDASTWPWPEPRLTYANAACAEALLVAGHALPNRAAQARGLNLLGFLMGVETSGGHLSVTPVGGRGIDELDLRFERRFDQQPIEVAAIADACATAYRITADPRYLVGVNMAWRWFLGENDSAALMFDPATGAGYDGLQADGPNLNQGAESTLAMLSTAQHGRHVRELR